MMEWEGRMGEEVLFPSFLVTSHGSDEDLEIFFFSFSFLFFDKTLGKGGGEKRYCTSTLL